MNILGMIIIVVEVLDDSGAGFEAQVLLLQAIVVIKL
jgi:hypothetical protein